MINTEPFMQGISRTMRNRMREQVREHAKQTNVSNLVLLKLLMILFIALIIQFVVWNGMIQIEFIHFQLFAVSVDIVVESLELNLFEQMAWSQVSVQPSHYGSTL